LKPWDTAAGALIVEEAGGRVSGFDGTSFSVRQPQILASNGRIHEALVEVFRVFQAPNPLEATGRQPGLN
jgi:myo-inositol-1(or 4)-monophosphatase